METVERSDAYRLGQLLARLDRAGAIRDVHRLYALASIDPATMVPAIRTATVAGKHLLIGPIMEHLSPDAFERPLTMREQSDFALGYHHERAG